MSDISRSEREKVKEIEKVLGNLIEFDRPELYSRDEWGSELSLEDFRPEFERVFTLSRVFTDLPYHLLPDKNLDTIRRTVDEANTHLQTIISFSVATASTPPLAQIQKLGEGIATYADKITVEMAPWISFLAYQKGDVSRNINEMNQAVTTCKSLLSKAEEDIIAKQLRIEKIVQQAQDMAGDRGVSVFTEQFNTSAKDAHKEATTWLRVTAAIFSVCLILLIVFIFSPPSVNDWWHWAPRAAMVAVLLTAGLWAGKSYRILRHQEATNRHKANGLKTFLAFREASDDDPATRNAVLLETTRAIFTESPSGFVPNQGGQSESGIRIIDSARVAGIASNAQK